MSREEAERFRKARRILVESAPPRALWFLAGGSPCFLYKGRIAPMIFEDTGELDLIGEFLRETAPMFQDYTEASLELLGNTRMRLA